jgi:hypothetical protein
MRSSFGAFLSLMFQPFFKWWWAVVTGAASILAFVWTPPAGLTISKAGMLLLVLIGFTMLFLVLSMVVQGWLLFQNRHQRLELVALRQVRDFGPADDRPRDLGTDWVFLLRGYLPESTGMLIEIRRPFEEVELAFALVQVTGTTARGLYQASPLWISPGHLRDYSRQHFSANTLIAYPQISYDRAKEVFDALPR